MKCKITGFVDNCLCEYLWHFASCLSQDKAKSLLTEIFETILQLPVELCQYFAFCCHPFSHSGQLLASFVCNISKPGNFYTHCMFSTCSPCSLAHTQTWLDDEWRQTNEWALDLLKVCGCILIRAWASVPCFKKWLHFLSLSICSAIT